MKAKALILSALLAIACAGPKPSLPVMSFNIRLGVADDGENSWEFRKAAAAAMINDQKPAVFGVQEAYRFQLDYFAEACPAYKWVGVGREDGVSEGEHMSVFYDTTRVALKDWGTYWLSETPDVPSMGWDAACFRTATWALLTDKKAGKDFYFVNTHLDHVGVEARRNGLLLLVERIGAMNPEGNPMILCGDFNIYSDTPALTEIRTLMTDSRESAAVTDKGLTYHGWGTVTEALPIDYIFYKGFRACSSFSRITKPYLERPYVSDHYPVMAVLEY